MARRRQRAHASCRHRPQALPPIGASRSRSRSWRLPLLLRRSAAARADVVPPQAASGWWSLGLGRCCCERLRLRLRLRLLRLQRPALLPMATQALQNAPSRRVPGLPQQRALPAVPRVVAQRPLRAPLPLRALALSGPRLRHSASAPPPCASPSPPPSVPIQRGHFEVSPPQSGRCPAPGMRQVRAAVARPPHAMLRAPASFAHLPPPDAWPLLAPLPPRPLPRGSAIARERQE